MLRNYSLFFLSSALALAVLAVDLNLPLGVAGGVPYVAVILLGGWFPDKRQIILITLICCGLTVAGYFLSPEGGIAWMVLTNRGLAIFAIVASGVLLYLAKKTIEERESLEERMRKATVEPSAALKSQTSIQRIGGAGLVGAYLVLLMVFSTAYWAQSETEKAWEGIARTHEVRENLDALLSVFQDAETGQRGYLLTGNAAYLEPFEAAGERIDRAVSTLQALTRRHPAQQNRFNALTPLMGEKMTELRETIRLRQSVSLAAALAVVQTDRGKIVMDSIRHTIAVMSKVEEGVLDKWHKRLDLVELVEFVVDLSGYLLLIIIGATAGYKIRNLLSQSQKAERALQSSEGRYRALVQGQADLICRNDINGVLTFVNDAYCRYFGKPHGDLVGTSFLELLPEEFRQNTLDHLASLTPENPTATQEHEVLTPSGARRWMQWTNTARFDENGRAIEVVAVGRDISKRKRAETALQESEASLTNAQRIIHVGSWEWDIKADKLHWSDEVYRIFGLKPKAFDASYEAFLSAIHPEDREKVTAAVNKAIENKTPYDINHRVVSPDGEERIVHEMGEVTYDEAGVAVRMIGTVNDITIRKKAEEALQESERRFRAMATISPVGIYRTDRDGHCQYVNDRWSEITGLAMDEAFGEGWSEALHPEDVVRVFKEWAEAVANKRPFHSEYRFMHPDGKEVWVLGQAISEIDRDGNIVGYVGTITDITENKKNAELTNRMGRVLEGSFNEIYIFDGQTLKFTEANQGGRSNLGYTMEELAEMTPVDIKPEFSAEQFNELLGPLRSGELKMLHFETVHQRKDGSLYDVSIRLQLMSDQARGAFVAIIEDISKRKKAEEQLRQAQKMEAMGQLTGGVAHEFNNLLMGVLGTLEMVQEETTDEKMRQRLGLAINSSLRGRDMVKNLMSFAHQKGLKARPVNVNEMISRVVTTLGPTLGERIDITAEEVENPWTVVVDDGELEGALINLVVNARDAMPGGGMITLTSAQAKLDKKKAGRIGGIPVGEYMALGVTDTGGGMSPETAAKAFDPFFTTKEVGEGTGLGLSMVHGFASQSGGGVKIDSVPGKGTTVTIYLPRSKEKMEGLEGGGEAPEGAPEKIPGGEERILLVEDDVTARMIGLAILEGLGYAVVEAEDAASALEMFKNGAQFDLVVSDVVMPGGMSGLGLGKQIEKQYPGVKVLLCTGYNPEEVEGKATGKAHFPMISKPYRKEEIALKIRGILEGTS